MKFVLKITPFLTVLLFTANFQLCELFYRNDIESWWDCRNNISALAYTCALISFNSERTKINLFLMSVGVGFSISDVIDRMVFSCTEFTFSDLLMITITIYYSYKNNYGKRN